MMDIWVVLVYFFFILNIFIGIYLYFTATFNFWKNLGVPYKKPTIIVGNFLKPLCFRQSQQESIKEMYNWFESAQYFGVFRVRTPIFYIRDPELIKHICVRDFQCFINRGIPTNSQDPLSNHLFNLEGRQWKALRSKLSPVFSSAKIKRMFPLLFECHKIFEKLIHNSLNNDVDVRELAVKFTVDVIGTCAFGIQINDFSDENSEFRKVVKKLSHPGYKTTLWRMLRTAVPRLYKLLGVQIIDREITSFFKSIVSQVIEQREKTSEYKRNDFIDLLIELKNQEHISLKENEINTQKSNLIEFDDNLIAAQMFVFFVAGYETSANTIAFCLYELALNGDIQEKARLEILEAIEKNDGALDYYVVKEMKYLESIILETLRKYPPAPIISRRCEYPYTVPGTKIKLPTGMRVVIPIYGIHHDPNHYPQPDTFNPDRFDDKNESRHHYTFLPFGEGPRNCIGTKFAILQIKMGIISFLKNHKVEVCEKTTIPIKFSRRSLVTTSETGFWLKLRSI
ncbi:cytochrome P450 6a8-like isoform X2 [Chelonus insularis]|uniref:cytochrome P450 6a8-like isoform X2 n=1 Tax=Chelonus insularis TaxID=460826 RepID=UPI00158EBBD4|nr:cytochrome P450 6a8-like isoform X2 [Chelonus insularis]